MPIEAESEAYWDNIPSLVSISGNINILKCCSSTSKESLPNWDDLVTISKNMKAKLKLSISDQSGPLYEITDLSSNLHGAPAIIMVENGEGHAHSLFALPEKLDQKQKW